MSKKISIARCFAALVGIFFVGSGVAFNAQAQLGNDSVGIFYDGIRSALGLSAWQLGVASNVVNYSIVALLLVIARKYVNIGTFIYILPYGFFVNIGTQLYSMLFPSTEMAVRILAVIVGSICICLGVAIYIVTDIGVDPLTGLALYLGECLKWEYSKAKILFDVCLTVIGFVLGGKLGVITLIVTCLGGPTIQFFANVIRREVFSLGKKEIICEAN